MNELALFAGAGGGILGGILSGESQVVCAVEISRLFYLPPESGTGE